MHQAAVSSRPNLDDEGRARRVRRYASGVSIALMVLCNAIFLLGLWASGVNLDELVAAPDLSIPNGCMPPAHLAAGERDRGAGANVFGMD